MLSREQKTIRVLFTKLLRSPLQSFPEMRQPLKAPDKQGVYVIYDTRDRVVHVGRTPSGVGGIRQRLGNHLYNASSFSLIYLKGRGEKLRRGYKYRCLIVGDPKQRALLEAYAIGYLCPAHIGLAISARTKSEGSNAASVQHLA